MHKRSQAVRVIDWLIGSQMPENTEQSLLPNVFDQVLGADLAAEAQPDDGAEMGKELPFRF
jgi:hypothetical protein